MDDFTKFLQASIHDFKSIPETPVQKTVSTDNQPLQEHLQKLETENRTLVVKVEDLNKYNTNLNDQLAKYALLLSEEKSEKKDLLAKYDDLQKDHSTKVEMLYREKVKIERKYYLLLGIIIVLLLFFGFFMLHFNRLENF